jgi:hypothetical protein
MIGDRGTAPGPREHTANVQQVTWQLRGGAGLCDGAGAAMTGLFSVKERCGLNGEKESGSMVAVQLGNGGSCW